jgi:uncharacterized membrane protein
VLFVGAAAGLLFSAVSTYDFAQHLDRQVHGLHCSFVPGLGTPDATGTSGCHVTLMSPYSSVFRTLFWGGLPISLPGISVFAFLLWRAILRLVHGGAPSADERRWIALGAVFPVLATVVMGGLSLVVLDALCKVCAGIYASSLVVAFGAFAVVRTAGPPADAPDAGDDAAPAPSGPVPALVAALVTLGAFVALPAAAWAALAPDHGKYVGTCGKLVVQDDPKKVLVPLDPHPGARPAIEVLDPLCPSCKGFEDRLTASGHAPALDRRILLFPLDQECNWMVGSTMHPGACTVSEAVLCASGEDGNAAAARRVVEWAFAHQEDIRAASAADPAAAKAMVTAAFPDLAPCVGSAAARARLNHSLRWAVRNELPVLTPQLYVDGTRLCDADTDLGLDFTLGRLLAAPGARP